MQYNLKHNLFDNNFFHIIFKWKERSPFHRVFIVFEVRRHIFNGLFIWMEFFLFCFVHKFIHGQQFTLEHKMHHFLKWKFLHIYWITKRRHRRWICYLIYVNSYTRPANTIWTELFDGKQIRKKIVCFFPFILEFFSYVIREKKPIERLPFREIYFIVVRLFHCYFAFCQWMNERKQETSSRSITFVFILSSVEKKRPPKWNWNYDMNRMYINSTCVMCIISLFIHIYL